jgi:hypothetical protein
MLNDQLPAAGVSRSRRGRRHDLLREAHVQDAHGADNGKKSIARVGDLFMSLIHRCELEGVIPF